MLQESYFVNIFFWQKDEMPSHNNLASLSKVGTRRLGHDLGRDRTDCPRPMQMEEFDSSPTPQQRVMGKKDEEDTGTLLVLHVVRSFVRRDPRF